MERISWPNRITITRLLLVGPFVLALLNLQDPQWGETARYCAIVIFALMAVSDLLDGYLARKLHEETAIGRFLDPCADMILVVCSVFALAHEGTHVSGARLPSWVAVIVIGKEIIQIVGFCVVYIETSKVVIDPKRLGKWCMGTLMAMVLTVLISPDLPAGMKWLPQVAWWLASVLSIATVVQYFRMALGLLAAHDKTKAANE